MKFLPLSSARRPAASPSRTCAALLASVLLSCSTLASHAQVAKNAVREKIGGIDLVILKTGVKDVITVRGSLAAGDSLSPDDNPALADLTGGMLDKGTTQHDKFAISQLLGNAGANISFSTGPSALNINAKCLRADLPLVIGLIAGNVFGPGRSFHADPAKLDSKLVANYVTQAEHMTIAEHILKMIPKTL